MNPRQKVDQLKVFVFEGKEQQVTFVETMKVAEGVECDVYSFNGDSSKDLGIIRIKPGSQTPLQKVLKGDRTVEGYISGKGKLTITGGEGKQRIYEASSKIKEPVAVTVAIGELMQWEAAPDSNLQAYEECFPPYKDGRYENIKQNY